MDIQSFQLFIPIHIDTCNDCLEIYNIMQIAIPKDILSERKTLQPPFSGTPVARVLPQIKQVIIIVKYMICFCLLPPRIVNTHAPQRTQFVYHDGM